MRIGRENSFAFVKAAQKGEQKLSRWVLLKAESHQDSSALSRSRPEIAPQVPFDLC